ncbi:Fe-S oxidoreductase [Clostridia bacterium]|nr:Fe-S oxidoreductase [Clostridia bacterium]
MIAPTEVEAKAKRLERQNYKFRTFLKCRADDDKLDAQFLELHKELFANYDCDKCNNCCKTFDIILDSDEAKNISAFLGMTESDFAAKYLTDADVDDEKPFKFKANPCTFLGGDGCCRIQDCKPEVCKYFPYTDQPDRLSSMCGIIEHAEVCPVVFEILERLKKMYRFRNRA